MYEGALFSEPPEFRCVLDVCVVVLDYVTLANVLAEDRGADLTVLRFARDRDFCRGLVENSGAVPKKTIKSRMHSK